MEGVVTLTTTKLEIIIATRRSPMIEMFEGLHMNAVEPFPKVSIVTDNGQGQTMIRYDAALRSQADYILLLDDDVRMRKGVVDKYLSKIKEGYDAVCGSTNPVALNGFSKHVLTYGTNPSTPFYATGCTLWRRLSFIKIMDEIGPDINKHLGDNLLERRIAQGGYKCVRVEDAVSDHLIDITASKFLKKRIELGRAIGEMYREEGVLLKRLLTFLISLPLSRGRGVFLYRLGTLIGLVQFAMSRLDRKDFKE